jgi:MFS family permease
VGIANTVVGIGNSIAPLVGGWLAGLSYSWLFALSAALNLIGLIAMRWSVRDPRWQATSRIRTGIFNQEET